MGLIQAGTRPARASAGAVRVPNPLANILRLQGRDESPQAGPSVTQKGCKSGSGVGSKRAPWAKSSEAGTDRGGTDLILIRFQRRRCRALQAV